MTDLATRAVLSIAAVLLLTAGLGFADALHGSALRDAALGLATHLARQFDAVAHVSAEVTIVASRHGPAPIRLPTTLMGSGYHIEIRSHDVRVVVGDLSAFASLRAAIHPYPPGDCTSGAEAPSRGEPSVLRVLDGFVIERVRCRVDGMSVFATFVRLPR